MRPKAKARLSLFRQASRARGHGHSRVCWLSRSPDRTAAHRAVVTESARPPKPEKFTGKVCQSSF